MFNMDCKKRLAQLATSVIFASMLLIQPLSAQVSGSYDPNLYNVESGAYGTQIPQTNDIKQEDEVDDNAAALAAMRDVQKIDKDDRIFGDWLFKGMFASQKFIGFNPDYEIAPGDRIRIQMWGGIEQQTQKTVDPQGNIFMPKIGPVPLMGVKNSELSARVLAAVGKVYKDNIGVYASLAGAEPVKVFVTGFVMNPGLFAGHSSDSLLRFLDLAGGIDFDRGSFTNIDILRAGKVIQSVNLYDFILHGKLPTLQIFDGDTILVKALQSRVKVTGLVKNNFRFEFNGDKIAATDILEFAGVRSEATHVRIRRNSRVKNEVDYLALSEIDGVEIYTGDVVEVTSDKLPGTIAVRVEGEIDSGQEYILPYGATLGDLLAQVDYTDNAQGAAIQLFRNSVKDRQKEMLMSQLRALESSVLTARSNTREEAALRAQEAKLILDWVERAKDIEMKGQVVLGGAQAVNNILLESGDIVRVPRKSQLVMVHGDVLFPSAMAYDGKRTPADYIDLAGGYTQNGSDSIVLILHRDGTFDRVSGRRLAARSTQLAAGDEIFVLPKIQTKTLQITKDITQVLYQIAVAAGVVLAL